MKTAIAVLSILSATSVALFASEPAFLKHYQGRPYSDSHSQGGAQKIPGKVYCAYYDLGGEGVAYHDSDAVNHGSGELNPADGSYLNEFRMKEGVDTSYTKFGRTPDKIDDNPYERVTPPANIFYVGWTMPGEWFNVTVDVAQTGEYTADLLYTSGLGGAISMDVNGKPATGSLTIPSNYNAADPIAWRQMHHWNIAPNLVKLHLARGKNVLTVHIEKGQVNLAFFTFKKA